MSFLSAWITVVFPPDIILTKICNRVDSEPLDDSALTSCLFILGEEEILDAVFVEFPFGIVGGR